MRRERFTEDLESYLQQIEALKENGNSAEIESYLEAASDIDRKLQEAADKVGLIGWILSKSFIPGGYMCDGFVRYRLCSKNSLMTN